MFRKEKKRNVLLPQPPNPFPFSDDHLYADALQYRFYLCLYFWFSLYMHVQQVPFLYSENLTLLCLVVVVLAV